MIGFGVRVPRLQLAHEGEVLGCRVSVRVGLGSRLGLGRPHEGKVLEFRAVFRIRASVSVSLICSCAQASVAG